MSSAGRRGFLRRAGALAGGLVTGATLQALGAHGARAQPAAAAQGYGPLRPVADQRGQAVLALPQGFSYVSFSHTGSPMSDGHPVPAALDGMTALPGPGATVRLIRNHELRNAPGDFRTGVAGPAHTRYDPLAAGGCTIADFDPRSGKLTREFVVLNGTLANCSGGLALGARGWISCEETVAGPDRGWQRPHGYAFLVPADAEGPVPARALRALGRFPHEAAVAGDDGVVYQTEDPGPGHGAGFYRFLPREVDRLEAGGALQMLAVAGTPRADLRRGRRVGESLPVRWVGIGDPDPDLEGGADGVFTQGHAAGGARFNRLEGIFRGEDGAIWFTSTSGGDARNGDINLDGYREGYGQLWRYLPEPDGGRLELAFESPGGSVLDSPDNLCISPRGGILLCEDDAGTLDRDRHPLAPGIVQVNRLVGLARDGGAFEFAVNRLNASEFAGACFSPDGSILFVNIYGDGSPGSGMSFAISGPWEAGPL